MLKEEEIEKKRLAGIKSIKKRVTHVLDSDTPNKIPKTNIDNDQNTIYELPAVCQEIKTTFFYPFINIIQQFNF